MSDPQTPPPAATPATAELVLALRAVLHARGESTAVQAAAIGNVLALLFAAEAPTEAEAFAMVDEWARTMKWQIHNLGVTAEHS